MIPQKSCTSVSPVEPLEHRIAPAVALVDLATPLTGSNGFTIEGVASEDLAGISVSPAGDVNGDRRPDFLVGASGVNRTGGDDAGATYVVFGRAGGFPAATLDLSALDGTNGFRILGKTGGDFSGSVASRAGDVNADGFGDILIGAEASGGGAGAAYIVYGKRTFTTTPAAGFTVDLAAPGTVRVTEFTGTAAGDLLGFSVSPAGDVNRDGRADIILGAPGTSAFAGAAYVVFGRTGGLPSSFNVNTLTGPNGFKINGAATDDNFGTSVSDAGDVNRDGYADLIVGAPGADSPGRDDSGAAYVIFGKPSGFTATLALSSLTGANGFKIAGAFADDSLGSAVSGAGDFNRDGFADLVLGAKTAQRGALSESGSAYVIFGKRTFTTTPAPGFTVDLATLTTTAGFEIPGHEANAQLGSSVSRAGDMNRDGFADILIGASKAAPGGDTEAGSAYAIFGKRDAFAASFNLATLNGIDGFRIDGAAAGDSVGHAIGTAGDLNADGLADILIGAPRITGTASDGAAHVIYGVPLPVKIASHGRTAVLTDTDGDTIVVAVSKGFLAQADFTLGPGDVGLVGVNLSDDGLEFQGASLSITAPSLAIAGTRDGRVNVGAIDATGIDLVNVGVEGDLGQIDAGDANDATTGLARLAVRSLSASGAQTSSIVGRLGVFISAGDVLGVVDVAGSIGAASIAGDLDGSAAGTAAGLLRATGSIGNVTVTGSIIGGADAAGLIATGRLGRVTIGSSLTSADAAKPVSIFAGALPLPTNPLDPVLAIAGLVVRGDVLNARILADTDTTHSQNDSNAVIGNVGVRGNWEDSLLHSTGNIGNVTVLGNFSGTNTLGIVAGRRIGALTFAGDVSSDDIGTPLIIAAAGVPGSATGNLAMPSITVRGDVTNAWFLAGYGQLDFGAGIGPRNPAGSIGTVVVDGTWNASNLVAGVTDATQDGFGQNDAPGSTGRIAAILIRGAVTGFPGSHFGITANHIGAANISGTRHLLTSTTAGQSFDLATDVKLIEV